MPSCPLPRSNELMQAHNQPFLLCADSTCDRAGQGHHQRPTHSCHGSLEVIGSSNAATQRAPKWKLRALPLKQCHSSQASLTQSADLERQDGGCWESRTGVLSCRETDASEPPGPSVWEPAGLGKHTKRGQHSNWNLPKKVLFLLISKNGLVVMVTYLLERQYFEDLCDKVSSILSSIYYI
jgi:hypothetical protein